MMLWLLHEHHVLPGVYWRMSEGEKLILSEMYEVVAQERENT